MHAGARRGQPGAAAESESHASSRAGAVRTGPPLAALPGRAVSRAPRPFERVAEPTGGQHVAPRAANRSRRKRLQREHGDQRPTASWG